MSLISKLDNELSQLLKAQITFLNNPDAKGTITITLKDNDIDQYVLEKFLKRELEDMCDLKLVKAEELFLEKIGRIRPEFISYFKKNRYIAPTIVKDKGKVKEIVATGSLVDLLLVEYPLTAVVREHTINRQFTVDNLSWDDFSMEGLRRMQLKFNAIDGCKDIKVHLGGCLDRVSYQWYTVGSMALAGALKEKICSTNHLFTSFVLDIDPEAYVSDPMWLEHWDKKDIALDINSSDGWEGARVPVDASLVIDKDKEFRVVIDGSNILDAVHFVQHNSGRDITVILDEGFLSDMAYNWKNLKVVKKISQ